MPKLNINGKEVEVPKGTRVIEAAKQAGFDIPFYCYHPGLSIAGNCRMCLVEIEKTPKLQIACHTECADGMIVKTETEKVKQTRKHVLEFLLVNHPLDCPICDQAGECWLQDYYLNYGAYDSRVNEDKVKKHKAQPIGPNVMLDSERCILCSRCVRFTDEISKTNELGIVDRGDHSEITLFPGKELNNNYSGNVVDICPVGALTDRDFRFKARVWYLESQNSVCNGCSRGCNIQVQKKTAGREHHGRGERVMRLKPRFNEQINKWWICDEGRYGYKYHDQNRIGAPVKREGNQPSESHWETLFPEVAKQIQLSKSKFAVLLSPQMSNEEIYLAKKLFKDELKAEKILLVKPKLDSVQDDFLLRADRNPNSRGAQLNGFDYDDKALADLAAGCESGKIEGLILFGQDILTLYPAFKEKTFSKLKWTVYIGTNQNVTSQFSNYVLPSATHFEKDGTFTNFEGRVQRFAKGLEPLGEAKPEFKILVFLARQLGIHLHYDRAEEIFNEMGQKSEAFKGLSYASIGLAGADIRTTSAPMIPSLTQHSNLIFHQEILKQSDTASIRPEEKTPVKV